MNKAFITLLRYESMFTQKMIDCVLDQVIIVESGIKALENEIYITVTTENDERCKYLCEYTEAKLTKMFVDFNKNINDGLKEISKDYDDMFILCAFKLGGRTKHNKVLKACCNRLTKSLQDIRSFGTAEISEVFETTINNFTKMREEYASLRKQPEEVEVIEEGQESLIPIYDYRELNKLAEDNKFSFIRQKGDHAVYKNDLGHLVIIPQGRTIGKGLSIKIQKTIMGLEV